mgnify:FL=1
MEGVMEARREGNKGSFTSLTQSRMFASPPTETNEAAISTMWDGQLYLVLGKHQPDGRWQVRMWWKPFVTLIWLGGLLIAFGGLLAMIGRLRRELKPKGEAA